MLTAPTDIEVECTKTQLKAGLLLSLDGTAAVTEDISRQLIITGHCMTPKQIKNTTDTRTTKEIKWVTHKYL